MEERLKTNNVKTMKIVEKLCKPDLIAINAYDMTLQSLGGLYEKAQKDLLLELYEKGSYTTEEYINIINNKLLEIDSNNKIN